MQKTRIGMIGAQYGATVHAQNLAALRGTKAEIAGVCSRSRESAEAFARKFEVPFSTDNYDELLSRSDIDAVDLCVPPALHHSFAIRAAEAGKDIIVEKPLTGYFGSEGSGTTIGDEVPRAEMLKGARENLTAIIDAVRKNNVLLGYAENWVYAPPVARLRRLIGVAKGTILDMRAEESHSGSHSVYSQEWRYTGGGSLIRMGVHPIGAVLHLKAFEGNLKNGRPIRAESVVADVAPLMRLESVQSEATKWIRSSPKDVETWANVAITFEDGTKAVVTVTDAGLGGVQEKVSVFLSNAALRADIAQNTAVRAYAPDQSIFGDEYFTEKLETKAGWSSPSPDEDWFRGYPQEMSDFVDSFQERREPLASLDLAADCIELIYAAYQSAEEGRRIKLELRST